MSESHRKAIRAEVAAVAEGAMRLRHYLVSQVPTSMNQHFLQWFKLHFQVADNVKLQSQSEEMQDSVHSITPGTSQSTPSVRAQLMILARATCPKVSIH